MTMDVKKKLVELLDNFNRDLSKYAGDPKFFVVDDNSELADHLVANGVTVQQWIPVTERLPEKHKRVLTVSDNGNIDVDWVDKFGVWIGDIMSFDEVTHWMPLPEPPKGD